MKRTLILLLFISCYIFAAEPAVKFYLNDGSFKSYNLTDIDSIGLNKSNSISSMTVYNKIQNKTWSEDLAILNSIQFINKTQIKFLLKDSTIINNLVEIDSIIFSEELPLKITSIIPTAVRIGENIIINGTGFHTDQDSSFVTFNTKDAVEYPLWSEKRIIAKVPPGATNGNLTVTVNNQKSNEIPYKIIPFISSVNPAEGYIGTNITITGTGFGNKQDTNYISFSYSIKSEMVSNWNSTQIKLKIPKGVFGCSFKVVVDGIESNPFSFSILPKIISLLPKADYTGKEISIIGNGFGNSTGKVLLNGTAVKKINLWSDSLIKFIVPNDASSGKISITVSNKISNEMDFVVMPYILGVNPSEGITGTDVILTGTSFGNSKSEGAIFIGDVQVADITSWGNTEIKFKVPKNAVSGPLYVSVQSYKSNEMDFIVTPDITQIQPGYGYAGDSIVITGSGFGTKRGTSYVSIGQFTFSSYKSWSTNQITAVMPSGATTGKVSVTVNSHKSNDVNFIVYTVITDTVKIGTQTWTNKNLDVATYRNGDTIPQITDSVAWASAKTGAWCWYNNDAAQGAIYGRLYNWYAVNDIRMLAPAGWHIPTDTEWNTIINYLGGASIAGGKLKETGTTHWTDPNVGATNEAAYNGIPGGYRTFGTFMNNGTYAIWWTATQSDASSAYFRFLNNGVISITRSNYNKAYGFSIRCVKD